MDDDSDDDLYAKQLQEVFTSCDLEDKGYLNRNELIDLSQKLQLGDQVPSLLKELLGDEFAEGEVYYDAFREAFVTVLAKAIDNIGDAADFDQSDVSEFGDQYTRSNSVLSKIDLHDDDSFDVFLRDSSAESTPRKSVRNVLSRKTSTPHDTKKLGLLKRSSDLHLKSEDEEIVEGSGAAQSLPYRKKMSDASDLASSMNAQQLRSIWDNIAVGESGFLNLLQLSDVCDHIGMEGLQDDELEMLFSELDVDRDGFVSFKEFYNGLFAKNNLAGSENAKQLLKTVESNKDTIVSVASSISLSDNVDYDEDLSSVRSGCSIKSLKEIVRDDKTLVNTKPALIDDYAVQKSRNIPIDMLSFLDPNESGLLEIDKVRNYFTSAKVNKDLHNLLKDLTPNADGKIHTKELSRVLEAVVMDSDDTLCFLVLQTYKKEMSHLRDQLDISKSELNILRSNVSQLGSKNTKLTRDSEEQTRRIEMKLNDKVRATADAWGKKFGQQEQEFNQDRDVMLRNHEKEKESLEQLVERLRTEDAMKKNQLKDADKEIFRLEESLRETIQQLNSERKKRTTLEKDFNNRNNNRDKITDLERQVVSLSSIKETQNKQILELERVNKELLDQNDEYLAEVESTKEKYHKSIDEQLNRHGSYLSDYLKPDIVKRNTQGESADDVFGSGDMDDLRIKVIEQETIISGLRRDLETVNKLLEENTSTSNERHRREINRLTEKYTSEILNLQKMMGNEREEIVNHYSKEKNLLVDAYEKKIKELDLNHKNEKDSIQRDYENERDRWNISSDADRSIDKEFSFKRERRKIEKSFREEKEEIELNYRSQITKLEEKIVILDTEKAEMELKFLNEKGELEQKFRIERAELQQNATVSSREVDKSQKYNNFLKEDMRKKHEQDIEEIKRHNKREKETMLDNMETELEDITKKHERELNELKRSYNTQVSEMGKNFAKEKASMREGFCRERTELEQQHLRDKTNLEDTLVQKYEHDLTVQSAELRKASADERLYVEEQLRQELVLSLQQEKNNNERRLKQLRTEMEIEFSDEKVKMREEHDSEKTLLLNKYSRELSELQNSLSGGEAGLKGKMRDDFNIIISNYKREWEQSYLKEKLQLQESYTREKAQLELSWQVEKSTMEENFYVEKCAIEENFEREKQELNNKYQKQKLKSEEDFQEQFNQIKLNREDEFNARVERETEHLLKAASHLEVEVNSLKDQKRELETKNQILELRELSQKQEAAEICMFQEEKKQLNKKITVLLQDIEQLQSEKEQITEDFENVCREKAVVLENSVQEITYQQNEMTCLQRDKEAMEIEINKLKKIENEAYELKNENMKLSRENSEKECVLLSLKEVEKDNSVLNETVRSLDVRETQLKASLKNTEEKLSTVQEDVSFYQNKLENLESVYKNDKDAWNEKINMQTAAFTTEKSKYLRELQELKDHLHRANMSSDRDNALKEKVFNDAKAEVLNLNKKLEEKSRMIRSLDDSMKLLEEKLSTATRSRDEYEDQVLQLKTMISENSQESKEEKKEITSKSIRSDVLVTELYLENADLMKQITHAESNQMKAEKQVRQLTEQKRALQRVISKLCHANGITNLN